MGASGHITCADAGMPAMSARCGGAFRHLGQVPAFLARCVTTSHLWQWLMSELTPIEPSLGQPALRSNVGLRINQLEVRLAQVHREPIRDVPAVVQFDGIWPEPGRPSKMASKRIVASGPRNAANGSWCWSRWAYGPMGVANGKSSIGS